MYLRCTATIYLCNMLHQQQTEDGLTLCRQLSLYGTFSHIRKVLEISPKVCTVHNSVPIVVKQMSAEISLLGNVCNSAFLLFSSSWLLNACGL